MTILALAGILAATGIFLSQIRSLGVLTTYDARTRLYLGIAAWNLALPLIVSAVIGALVAAFLGTLALQIRRTGEVSVPVLSAALLGIAAIAIALTLLCGTTAARAVRTWHPSKD
ncbi:hypothetical protein [Salinispora oceanensis]|uniref:hypothetical protein n=1 Tax=Salinispora oceanensis TaxID=1050199 RepID=UPI0003A910AC|nr:hypothetical protein [Salinispora oceanensis]